MACLACSVCLWRFFKIKTLKLHRTKYSFLELDDMNEGEYRYLTKEDISNFSI